MTKFGGGRDVSGQFTQVIVVAEYKNYVYSHVIQEWHLRQRRNKALNQDKGVLYRVVHLSAPH